MPLPSLIVLLLCGLIVVLVDIPNESVAVAALQPLGGLLTLVLILTSTASQVTASKMVKEGVHKKTFKTFHAEPRPPGLQGLLERVAGWMLVISLGSGYYVVLALLGGIVWSMCHGQVSLSTTTKRCSTSPLLRMHLYGRKCVNLISYAVHTLSTID